MKYKIKTRRYPLNMWTFCDEGCYTDLKHGRCWIDWEDWPKVKDYRWGSHKRHNMIYVVSYRVGPLHTFILPAEPPLTVDHADFNGLDNRKYNLRIATKTQQNWHRRKRKDTFLRFKGVKFYKHKFPPYYLGYVQDDKGVVHCKGFNNLIEAAYWYNQTALLICGKFAVLNELLPEEILLCTSMPKERRKTRFRPVVF